MRRARRCRHHNHYGHGGDWGGPPWHRGWGRRGLFMALSHIDASPAQERAIVNEVDRFRDRIQSAKATAKDGRADLAAALRNPTLDDAALGAWLGRVDAATGEARSALLDAVRNIHGVLDDKQRERVADLLDRNWWHRGGGSPYRV
jgi:uncharacterized membrane protein